MTATKTQTESLPEHVAHESLTAALAAFQAEIPAVRKERKVTVDGDHGPESFMVADLSTITERAMPVLGKHGLSFSTKPTTVEGGGFVLQYALIHETGDCITGTFPLPDPFLFDAQDVGAAITRARRIALCAVTGVAPGGDPYDGRAAKTSTVTKADSSEVEPSRDWLADAALAIDKASADALWAEARKGVTEGYEPKWILDEIAAVWRKRKAEHAPEVTERDDVAEETAA